MSKLGREISILLQHPDDWECDKYCLKHKPTGIELWIANGPFFLDVWNRDRIGAFDLLERHWLWFTQVGLLVKKLKPKKPTKEEKIVEVMKILNKNKIS